MSFPEFGTSKADDDFRRFHIVRFRADSQVSICVALAFALAVVAALARIAALTARVVLTAVIVLV
jgi:hypothetical protein